MGRYFGTDGIRGHATAEVFQFPFLGRLARALAVYLDSLAEVAATPAIVVGRDPRASGERIVADLTSALTAAGCRVIDAGVAPTPALAKAVIDLGVDLGVVVTASHNPASDNGIKLFARGGTKFADATEAVLETLIDAQIAADVPPAEPAETYDAVTAYIRFASGLLPAHFLAGWKIALDCAHGATARTSPEVLRRLGAEVVAIGIEPDGENINDGLGSEHPEKLSALVRETGARLGIAHDGDGDRLILVDETGTVVNGDAVLGFIGQYLAQAGKLSQQTIVATVMSNLGLDRALAAMGGQVRRTPVGDRQVFQRMRAEGLDFGGENSGHLIVRRILPTGDGLIAALQVLKALEAANEPLSVVAGRIKLYPQILRNRAVAEKIPLEDLPELMAGLEKIAADLGDEGRILVRYSGTESKIRLLVEAKNQALAEETLDTLEDFVGAHLQLL